MVDEAADAEIKITIRQSSGSQFEISIKPSSTIAELKKACEEGCQLAAES